MRSFLIILQQTYLQSVRTKSFGWITILLILLGACILAFPSLIEKFSSDEKEGNYVFISTIPHFQIKQEQLQQFNTDNIFRLGQPANIEEYKEKILQKKLDGLFILKMGDNSSTIQLDYYINNNEPLLIQQTKFFIEDIYFQQVIKEENIDLDIASSLAVQVEPNMQHLRNTDSNSFFIIYLLIGIMYLAITTYGNSVATAIAAEKSSRVMEVMITKISPVPMMCGKVLGIGLASLTQLFIFFSSIGLFTKLEIFNIPSGSIAETLIEMLNISYTIYFLIFFILGYFIYASLFAVIGSMVSRPEELSSTSIPITIILMASLAVEMVLVIDHPDSVAAEITSYIPFTAPISLMVRIINDTAVPFEIMLSIGMMLASIVLFALLAAKIYPKGILKNDQKLTFTELFAKK
ncbi:ABC transporter permease [Metabacillus fastidiosus]|uniref:ABC transporter permease n=1 Tax=Metabacillus fastidiosus TaxID=1458 RepID=UPI000824E25A|nr:ABC transporter permease [Metabacillus fastidiosus]MED4455324.1 ABC transporter permease [Metabacillus fastidiosus]MED4461515.1 ABC transporter permease [Metabacillus fastidiosus]